MSSGSEKHPSSTCYRANLISRPHALSQLSRGASKSESDFKQAIFRTASLTSVLQTILDSAFQCPRETCNLQRLLEPSAKWLQQRWREPLRVRLVLPVPYVYDSFGMDAPRPDSKLQLSKTIFKAAKLRAGQLVPHTVNPQMEIMDAQNLRRTHQCTLITKLATAGGIRTTEAD